MLDVYKMYVYLIGLYFFENEFIRIQESLLYFFMMFDVFDLGQEGDFRLENFLFF